MSASPSVTVSPLEGVTETVCFEGLTQQYFIAYLGQKLLHDAVDNREGHNNGSKDGDRYPFGLNRDLFILWEPFLQNLGLIIQQVD